MKFKITMTIELSDIFSTDKDQVNWLLSEVLNSNPENYYLHSNEIGDELGKIIEINSIEKLNN